MANKEPEKLVAHTREEWAEIRKKWAEEHPIAYWFEENIEKGIWWPTWRFLDKYFNFVNHCREIKWFIQRGMRGWADCDAWGYDSYNARVNEEALLWLKEHKHGVPNSMIDVPENEQRNPTDEEVKAGQEKWNKILDKMIYAFHCIAMQGKGNLDLFYPSKEDPNKHSLADTDFAKEYPNHYLMNREEDDRMKEGMKLFIEHYFSLWD